MSAELKNYYVTLAESYGGVGYMLVSALNYSDARNLMFTCFGDKWCFMYENLSDLHINDRRLLGKIEVDNEEVLKFTNYNLSQEIVVKVCSNITTSK